MSDSDRLSRRKTGRGSLVSYAARIGFCLFVLCLFAIWVATFSPRCIKDARQTYPADYQGPEKFVGVSRVLVAYNCGAASIADFVILQIQPIWVALGAISTFAVAGFTLTLWLTSQSQLGVMRKTLADAKVERAEHIKEMAQSLDIAQNHASAAEKQATIAIASQRPYVFVREFQQLQIKDATGGVVAIKCIVVWENSGATPTRDLRMRISWEGRDTPLPDDFDFPDLDKNSGDSAAFIGPKAQALTVAFTIGAGDAAELRTEKKYLYIWGWAEYWDLFEGTPRHRSEFCNRVIATALPGVANADMIEFRHHKVHNTVT